MSAYSYWKIPDLPPIALNKVDLIELERIARGGIEGPNVRIGVIVEDTEITGASMDELFSITELPAMTRKLILEAREQGPDAKSVGLTLYHNHANAQVSSNDETWFYGKTSQIRRFFSKHRPWYWWFIGMNGSAIAGLLYVATLSGAVLAISSDLYWLLSGSFVAFVGAVALTSSAFSGKPFPYVRIELVETNSRFSYETRSLLISGFSVVVGIAGIAVTLGFELF